MGGTCRLGCQMDASRLLDLRTVSCSSKLSKGAPPPIPAPPAALGAGAGRAGFPDAQKRYQKPDRNGVNGRMTNDLQSAHLGVQAQLETVQARLSENPRIRGFT